MVLVNSYEKLCRWNELSPDLESGLRASIERLGVPLRDPWHYAPEFNCLRTGSCQLRRSRF